MFRKKTKDSNIERLDEIIQDSIVKIGSASDVDKLASEVEKLERLISVRDDISRYMEIDSNTKKEFSKLAITGAIHLTSILLILHYEKTDVITSKAFSLASRFFKEGV